MSWSFSFVQLFQIKVVVCFFGIVEIVNNQFKVSFHKDILSYKSQTQKLEGFVHDYSTDELFLFCCAIYIVCTVECLEYLD